MLCQQMQPVPSQAHGQLDYQTLGTFRRAEQLHRQADLYNWRWLWARQARLLIRIADEGHRPCACRTSHQLGAGPSHAWLQLCLE